MALTLTVVPGKTMVAGEKWDVDDWNAAFRPSITIAGGVGASDIAADAVSASQLGPNAFNGAPAVAVLELTDKIPVYDFSASDNGVVTVSVLMNAVFSLGAAATAFTSYSADLVSFWTGTSAATMTVARFAEQLLAQAPALTATGDADEVLVHDASATDGSQATRVTLANLLPDKITAGTYVGITSLTLDAKGRATAVSTTGGGSDQVCWVRTTGASGTAGQSISATTLTVLNLSAAGSVSWAALATNVLTLQPGTYEIDVAIPIVENTSSSAHTVMVYDGTAGTPLATQSQVFTGDVDQMNVPLRCVVTLAVASAITFRIYSTKASTIGSPDSNGYTETFVSGLIRRLA